MAQLMRQGASMPAPEKLADRALLFASVEFKERVLMSQIDELLSIPTIPSEDLTQDAIVRMP